MASVVDMRRRICVQAENWLGLNEADGSFKPIIDIYNSHKPIARGYKVKYTDEWCATFVSAVFIKAGLVDLIPTECGCEEMIGRFKSSSYPGTWVEDDNYRPTAGDIIMYHWNSPSGENTGRANHTGIVVEVRGDMIVVVEGNHGEEVKTRTIEIGHNDIRGFAIPSYAEKAEDESYFVSKKFFLAKSYDEALAYAIDLKANVYDKDGECLYEYVEYEKTYKVTTALRLRADAGTLYKALATMPKDGIVTYLNESKTVLGTTWYKVSYNDKVGWASSKYLKEI